VYPGPVAWAQSPASEPDREVRSPDSADDSAIVEEERGQTVSSEAQLMVVAQEGTSGYQSQAGAYFGPGSERALIIQPSGLVTIRKNSGVEHEFSATVDIVSAASANSVDATSKASAVNEAVDFRAGTRVPLGEHYTFESTVGLHFEEPLRAVRTHLGITRELAQGSASIGASIEAVFDHFDNHLPNGETKDGDSETRTGYNANISFSQLLSPTSVLLLGYGYTHQRGSLRTPWNSVPLSGGLDGPALRGGERFPETRDRHAGTVELAQFIPPSRSTLRLDYRYYSDSFDIRAHNVRFRYYQYLSEHFLVRAHYRFYVQSAAYFFGTSFPQTVEVKRKDVFQTRPYVYYPGILQTSDSDLDAFVANEIGAQLGWLLADGDSFDLGYTQYFRSNGLSAKIFSLGYATQF
jgi:hypothetical protein